jgi:HlyD family secretion protein
VRIVVWEREDALQVPLTALFREAGGWALFVDDDGRARLRTVEVGRRSGLTAQVVAGVEAGERVVVHPSDRIADGVRIRSREGV